MKNFASLEGLRAWLAWWVVFTHTFQVIEMPSWLPGILKRTLPIGGMAVDTFIILSGFVITHLLLTKQEPYKPYLVRRFMRVAPVYFFCLLVGWLSIDSYHFLFAEVSFNPAVRVGNLARAQAIEEAPFAHLLIHVTMLHGLWSDTVWPYIVSTTIVPSAWSLSLEWQFYLLAPFLICSMRSSRDRLIGVVAMMSVGFVAERLFSNFILPSALPLALHWFAVGIGSRLLMEYLSPRKVPTVVVFLVLALLTTLFKSKVLFIWSLWMMFVLHEQGILPQGKGWKILMYILATNPIVRKFGRASYSTYLIHMSLMGVVTLVWSKYGTITTPQQLQAVMLVALLVVAGVSLFMYTWIEKPGIRLGAMLARRCGNKKPI